MRQNKITIIIDKPIEEVFEFTTNPKNTHLWIPSIEEEISEEYPPKINIQYKNRGESPSWDIYKVIEFEENETFVLSDLDGDYTVKYTYKKLGENQTEMEYFEWMKEGELSNPFTEEILQNLKSVMENLE